MVNLFTNCDGCVHKPDCLIKFNLHMLRDDVIEVDYKYGLVTDNTVSINIKCNKYQTDYGKGLGN